MRNIKIRFHKDLYPIAAVEKAIKTFSHVTNAKLEKKKEYYIVTLVNRELDKELLLRGNFLNCVLMFTKTIL